MYTTVAGNEQLMDVNVFVLWPLCHFILSVSFAHLCVCVWGRKEMLMWPKLHASLLDTELVNNISCIVDLHAYTVPWQKLERNALLSSLVRHLLVMVSTLAIGVVTYHHHGMTWRRLFHVCIFNNFCSLLYSLKMNKLMKSHAVFRDHIFFGFKPVLQFLWNFLWMLCHCSPLLHFTISYNM